MPLIASEVTQEAAEVFLNDSSRAHFTDTVLLPHLKRAYGDLQLELFLNGMIILDEKSAPLTLPALATSMETAAILPSDLVQPITIFERALTTDGWGNPIEQKDWEDNDDPALFNYLGHYAWREQDIKFRGANRDIYLLLRYRKELSSIASISSTIPIFNSKPFLAAKTASYAAGFGGGNEVRAQTAGAIAGSCLAKLIAVQVREEQIPVRRKSYGSSRRRRRSVT